MDAATCLKKLEYVGVLSFATVGLDGTPQVRCVSAIHYEHEKHTLYFLTAKGKNFCAELLHDGHVQILAYTRFKEMIRVSAKAVPVPDEDQERYKDIIFAEQPYLANVYPGDTRNIDIIFMIRDMEIEYFNLGVNPIFREIYQLGNVENKPKGYFISDSCIGCGICVEGCPQKAIELGVPSVVHQEHCLHCGRCMELCPNNAVIKL